VEGFFWLTIATFQPLSLPPEQFYLVLFPFFAALLSEAEVPAAAAPVELA